MKELFLENQAKFSRLSINEKYPLRTPLKLKYMYCNIQVPNIQLPGIAHSAAGILPTNTRAVSTVTTAQPQQVPVMLSLINPYSAGIGFSRQNLTSVDIRF